MRNTKTIMKLFKYFAVIVLLCIATLVSAQQTPHLTFKGVPICGTLKEFTNKMVAKGLTHVKSNSEGALYNGPFASYSNCSIVATVEQPSNEVSDVIVIFPSRDEWMYLEAIYLNIKGMLQEKYGNPTECVEEFEGGAPKDDVSKMLAAIAGKFKCCTKYELTGGAIFLRILNGANDMPQVFLQYHDSVNAELNRKRALEDL